MKAHIQSKPLDERSKKQMLPLIKAEILKHQDQFYTLNCAAILWALHETFGFGEQRLKRFWDSYFKIHDETVKYYELDDEGEGIVYIDCLKHIGVDIEKWIAEKR